MILELEPVFNNIGFSLDISYELDLSRAELNAAYPFKSPVRVSGRAVNNAGVVSVEAAASFDMSLECDRCAVPITKHSEVPVRHVLVTELNDDTNDELILLEGMRLDLDKLVTDDIFLSLPSKFLCSDDCRGVCPQCGQNLNVSQCSCRKPVDPRLEALKQLLDN
jgi:uncharacterized protein